MPDLYPGDDILLRRLATGDEDALFSLHKQYANLVYSMARRVLHDGLLAEEVTQDVFVKLWQKGYRYDPGRGSFASWLLGVTRYAAIDRLRSESRRPVVAESREDEAEGSWVEQLPVNDHAAWEQGQHLRLLLAHLPAEQRQVVELAFFGGLTHSELAEQLGLPLGTVKGRLRLGLDKLRSLWAGE